MLARLEGAGIGAAASASDDDMSAAWYLIPVGVVGLVAVGGLSGFLMKRRGAQHPNPQGGELDDHALIANARRGDIGAFEELVRRYQESAFRTAYLVLRDAADAEDAVQEGLVNAYNAIGKGRFREGSAFRPWLLKIVVNQSLNMPKSRKRRTAVAERAATESVPPEYAIDETLIDRERARLVYRHSTPSRSKSASLRTFATFSPCRSASWPSTSASRPAPSSPACTAH